VKAPGDQRGFTLLELLIALAIVGALLTIAFGGLRVALAAWAQGEDRAEAHQYLRSIALVLGRAVGAAYPYRASAGDAPEPVVLFRGTAERVELVTQAPPLPAPGPVAFTAVVIALESADGPALVVRQRALPNRDPFTEAPVVLRDPAIHGLELAYLDAQGGWVDQWNAAEGDGTLPRAVRMTVATQRAGRAEVTLPLTVPVRTVVAGAP
jgi:general secretion pathway protein J